MGGDNGVAVHRRWRRRCAWCCVRLAWWQLDRCRLCSRSVAQPPCPRASRLDAEPDRLGAWL